MARTFTPITGSGLLGAFADGDRWGYQTAERVRQGLDMMAYLGAGWDLGGEETTGLLTGVATWMAVSGAREFTIDGDNLGGLTLEVVLHYYTTSAATAVQLRVRNTTDSTTAATGTSSTSTTLVKEVVTVTMASGNKVYRLEALGDATNPVIGWGYLRLRKVPA